MIKFLKEIKIKPSNNFPVEVVKIWNSIKVGDKIKFDGYMYGPESNNAFLIRGLIGTIGKKWHNDDKGYLGIDIVDGSLSLSDDSPDSDEYNNLYTDYIDMEIIYSLEPKRPGSRYEPGDTDWNDVFESITKIE